MTIVTESILVMRLYAMYERSKYMLWFLVTWVSISAAASLALLFTIFAEERATDMPLGESIDLHSCSLNFKPAIAGGFYVVSLVTETMLFLLAVWKGIQYVREALPRFGERPRISDVLLRDSIMYFFIIFATYFVAGVYWFIGGTSHVELAGGFVLAIPAIMSEKLLLHIREHYHGLEVSAEPILPLVTNCEFISHSGPPSPMSPTSPS